jgi:hypothetical protein
MRKPNATYWLFRTRKVDGTLHPRWRIRYRGPNGRMAFVAGFRDGELERFFAPPACWMIAFGTGWAFRQKSPTHIP